MAKVKIRKVKILFKLTKYAHTHWFKARGVQHQRGYERVISVVAIR